jgi:hypothetical protein
MHCLEAYAAADEQFAGICSHLTLRLQTFVEENPADVMRSGRDDLEKLVQAFGDLPGACGDESRQASLCGRLEASQPETWCPA